MNFSGNFTSRMKFIQQKTAELKEFYFGNAILFSLPGTHQKKITI
jgi:hypothetical protein